MSIYLCKNLIKCLHNIHIDKFNAEKTFVEFLFESRYVNIDQLYDKFSITNPFEVTTITNN